MKPRLAPRHIIPTVCYALLFFGFALTALLGFTLDFTNTESLKGSGIAGLIVVGFAVAIKGILIIIGIGGSVATLFPIVFSSINIFKRGRTLAISCLVFDALWCQCFFFGLLTSLVDFGSFAPVIVSAVGFVLCVLPLVMNILNIKKNKPVAPIDPIAESLQTETEMQT